ncbi:MAG: hypothetical protein QW095_04630 [Nitrososphaerota archaeon]
MEKCFMNGRIGHIYSRRRRIGHIYVLVEKHGCKSEVKNRGS